MCFVDCEFFYICSGNFSIYFRTPHSAFFRYFVWCHTVRAIFFLGHLVVVISVFCSDRRWMLWQTCNMKLLTIFGVCSCHLFRNCVGRLTIITSKFCGVPLVNFRDTVPCVLLTNLSIFVGHPQWFLFLLHRAALRGWIITTFCCFAHGEFSRYCI